MTRVWTLAIFGCVLGLFSLYTVQVKVPRLVGYDCVGAHGPIFAFEEDEFPECRAIEEY